MLLVLFGASVTTMGAGMAVKGWLMPEGELTEGATWFLPLFPLEEWFRDPDTFVEHTHRMFGIVVGLLSIATVAATHLLDKRAVAKAAAWIGLVAISVQGVLGGTRVLEDSQHLAFLHGAFGQLVFAVLCGVTLVLSPLFQDPPSLDRALAGRISGRAKVASFLIYGQVLLGAWFRHSVRIATTVEGHDELPFPMGAFIAHAMGAMVVLVVALVAAKAFADAKADATERGDERGAQAYGRFERALQLTFVVQFLLGLGALATLGMERTAFGPIVSSSLHLLFGTILLAAALWAWLMGARLGSDATDGVEQPRTAHGAEAAGA